MRQRVAFLRTVLAGYEDADEIVWMQEEPENMGAWEFVRPHLAEAAPDRPLRVIARPRSASPAEGSAARHARQQQILVDAAFAPSPSSSCALPGVRFQTTTSYPAFARFRAMPDPILPKPRKPVRMSDQMVSDGEGNKL